ncbi:hypothetical protein FBEOM_576 [Fusarium beomiforme]|uniref:C3H1-type domain-containing protein n=1 Tax=Fusarium beomiforme TaxID=44412 RepID=A0A9P5AVT7_9HYPO|nr:hypothetical protein FBEOM_576 [Fusarium beomiforme]
MDRSSSMELSQNFFSNHSHTLCGNEYPVQPAYGGLQESPHVCQTSAPRSMKSDNWRGSQPSSNPMGSIITGTNYSLAGSSPRPSPSNGDGGPVSISDCLNGYAYCVKRPDGRYTRLVPADMLPALNELPATQTSAQGMVLLPDLHVQPPQGVAGMNQPVTFKTRIDRIVASHAQQRRTKIYCDKWIHDGTCAFTQQGCKYKHEMPFDKATQQSLGLFHGFPKWWRDLQEELQKHRDRDSPTSRSRAINQPDWRSDINDDTPQSPAALAPIGAERTQTPSKGNRLSRTHEGLATATAFEKRSRKGSETAWPLSSPTSQSWNVSSHPSSSGSVGQVCLR